MCDLKRNSYSTCNGSKVLTIHQETEIIENICKLKFSSFDRKIDL